MKTCRLRWVALALLTLALIVAVTGAMLILRSMSRPLELLASSARHIAGGDYSDPPVTVVQQQHLCQQWIVYRVADPDSRHIAIHRQVHGRGDVDLRCASKKRFGHLITRIHVLNKF